MKKINTKKLSGGLKFFILVCILYSVLGIFNSNIIFTAFLGFFEILKKILPLLLFVFIINIFVNLFFTSEIIKKYFGKDSGISAWFYAIISGILISGPPYVLYPLIGDMKRKGMKVSLIAIFLYNRNVKITFLPVLVFYFGISYAILLSVLIIIFSIFNGMLVGLFLKQTH